MYCFTVSASTPANSWLIETPETHSSNPLGLIKLRLGTTAQEKNVLLRTVNVNDPVPVQQQTWAWNDKVKNENN